MWTLLSLVLWAPSSVAQDAEESSPSALVAVPSFQGHLPDGTPVLGIIIVPAENVLERSAAWAAFQAQWPTAYRITPSDPSDSTPARDVDAAEPTAPFADVSTDD